MLHFSSRGCTKIVRNPNFANVIFLGTSKISKLTSWGHTLVPVSEGPGEGGMYLDIAAGLLFLMQKWVLRVSSGSSDLGNTMAPHVRRSWPQWIQGVKMSLQVSDVNLLFKQCPVLPSHFFIIYAWCFQIGQIKTLQKLLFFIWVVDYIRHSELHQVYMVLVCQWYGAGGRKSGEGMHQISALKMGSHSNIQTKSIMKCIFKFTVQIVGLRCWWLSKSLMA